MDAKRTKRVHIEELSLQEHIAQHRKRLLDDRARVPQLLEEAREIRARADTMTARHLYRARRDAQARADAIEAESAVRASMTREHAFEQTVVTYLRMYHAAQPSQPSEHAAASSRCNEAVRVFVQTKNAQRAHQNAVVHEYLTEMGRAPPQVAMAVRDVCVRCADQKLVLNTTRSVMCCPECGYSVAYLDATSSSTTFDEVTDFQQYSYKRVNHYLQWLALVQGKEAYRVSDDILQAVMCHLYDEQGITRSVDISQAHVRTALRRLRLRKAYDHVAQVTARISGAPAKHIPPEMETRLKNMFLQMQPAFARHAPRTRTNFLSYPYVLYRSFQILGLNHMLDDMVLLKGRDKLEANDAIFRKMCIDLGWPVFELPP